MSVERQETRRFRHQAMATQFEIVMIHEDARYAEQCAYEAFRRLDRLAKGGVHQGVLLEADPLPVERLEEWIERTPRDDAVIVALDGIEDPQNFGAIIRSAAAAS